MRNLDHVREHGKTGGRGGVIRCPGGDTANDFRGKLSGCDPFCVRQDTPSRSRRAHEQPSAETATPLVQKNSAVRAEVDENGTKDAVMGRVPFRAGDRISSQVERRTVAIVGTYPLNSSGTDRRGSQNV
jgi:hypothetical protein